ncbi:MAG TPA: polysaccharide deacetylase family protein [Ignavibacteria bacterium]|nr:polysaccharide deacetylase family protein [Ignavibacteria bacterium]HMR00119.1 polysaccharide deacetylase family protein [Ignavibacteria bacterium]
MYKLSAVLILIMTICQSIYSQETKPQLSITIDDPNTENSGNLTWMEKDDAILETLDKHGIKAALFVCGKRINSAEGKVLLNKWNEKGHMICNHSYSHSYYHSKKITPEVFENDFLRCDSIINGYSGYSKLFRYPYLKEGDTPEKRDGFRKFMHEKGYKHGYVTIDASDWYIDSRAVDTLKVSPALDLTPYKEYYITHIYNRAMFYDSLAVKLTGRHIKHTLLLHHNFINSQFLGELLIHFEKNGWELINASDAFNDEVFTEEPDILPAGESIIWALAKETGNYENVLRYPGEDSEYEEIPLNNLLKTYYK